MKKRLLALSLSFTMILMSISSNAFALSSENIEDESYFSNEAAYEFNEADGEEFTIESDLIEDDDIDPGIEEDVNLDTEVFGEALNLGISDEDIDESEEGYESETTINEDEELFIELPEDDEDNEVGYEYSEDLDEYTPEDIEGGDEKLDSAGAKLTCAQKVTIGVGRILDFKLSHTGKGSKYSIKVQDESICTANFAYGDNKYIYIKGKKSGSTYITVKLKGGIFNLITYDTKNIKVNVPKVSASASSVIIPKGVTKKINFSYSNCPDNVYMVLKGTNLNKISCKWGRWTKKSIPLTIKGKSIGSSTLYIYMIDKISKRIVGEKKITLRVTNPPTIKASKAKVSVFTGKTTTVNINTANLSEESYISVSSTNTKAFALSWSNVTSTSRTLTIKGLSKGTGTVVAYLRSSADKSVLAKTTIKINVSQTPAVTASKASISLKTAEKTTFTCKTVGISGDYRFNVKYSNPSSVAVSFGKRSGNSVPITVSGLNAGNSVLTISAVNSSGKIVASKSINVTCLASGMPYVAFSNTNPTTNVGRTETVTAYVRNFPAARRTYYAKVSDPSICRVNVEGTANPLLTIKGLKTGECLITFSVRNAETNQLLDERGIVVRVKAQDKYQQVSYNFVNFAKANTLRVCKYMFGNTQHAVLVNNTKYGNRGNCYGMATSSALIYAPNEIYASTFGNRTNIRQLRLSDKSNNFGLTVQEWIMANHISFYSDLLVHNYVQYNGGSVDLQMLNNLVDTVKNNPYHPTVVCFNKKGAGHAVTAYGFETVNSTKDRIIIYDSYSPFYGKAQYLNLYKSNGQYTGKWDYVDGYSSSAKNSCLNFTTYDEYKAVWDARGHLSKNPYIVSNRATADVSNAVLNMVAVNSYDFTINDVEGNEIAVIEDGILTTERDDIKLLLPPDYDEEDIEKTAILYLPIDVYEFNNEDNNIDKFSVQMADLELSTYVETDGNQITMCADDSNDFASAVLDTEDGESYNIVLGSSREGEPEKMEWEGVGTGDTVSLMLNAGNLEMCNMENVNMSASEENDGYEVDEKYSVIAESSEHGNINPRGLDLVSKAASQSYEITPDEGYYIKDVLVDDESVGAVSTYTFDDVRSSHDIFAVFRERESIENAKVTGISQKEFSGKKRTQKITVTKNNKILKGGTDYKVSYKNNLYVGKATITITGIGHYNGTIIKKFSINPKPTKIKSLKRGTRKFTVKWSKKTVQTTGYQIRYSTSSKFKSAKTVTVKSYKTTSKTIKSLKAKKKYYVQVRTYKTVGTKKYYSAWSSKKYITTK